MPSPVSQGRSGRRIGFFGCLSGRYWNFETRLVSASSMSSTKSWRVPPISTIPEAGARAAAMPAAAWRNALLLISTSHELDRKDRRVAELEPYSHWLVFEPPDIGAPPDHLLDAAAAQRLGTIRRETLDRPARLVDERGPHLAFVESAAVGHLLLWRRCVQVDHQLRSPERDGSSHQGRQ